MTAAFLGGQDDDQGSLSRNSSLVNQLKSVECPDSTFGGFDPALVLAEGQGSWIKDTEGKSYIDLCAGFGALVLGHNPECQQAIFEPLSRKGFAPIVHGMGDVYASGSKVALLSALSRHLPAHLNTGALSVTGSQAVEMAVRTAYLYNRRPYVLSFEGCYHGTDLGVLPYTHSAKFKESFRGLVPDRAIFVPYGASADEIDRKLKDAGIGTDAISAILVEPVQGRAGVRLPPTGWLGTIASLAKSWGALVIYDEVFTGMGRAGALCLAAEKLCDIVCLGKGLGGGMPISACFSSAEIMAAWPESTGEAQHTGTFFGHPLSCAVASSVIYQLVTQRLAERSASLGAKALAYLQSALPAWQIRGQGLMMAVEGSDLQGLELMNRLRKRGVHALVSGSQGQCLALTPALTIAEELLFKALDQLVQAADEIKL